MDANNCGLTQTVSITQPTAALSVSAITTQSVLCFGASTGSASLTVNGGTSAYTYTWLPTGGNNTTATGLTAQEYTVNIIDANNCALTQTLSITEPTAALAASITNTTQAGCGLANGEATVIATGGTPVYTYSWTNASNTTYTTSSNTTNSLSAGSNNVTLTDANGCIYTLTTTITNPNAPIVTTSVTNVLCYGQNTGAITTTVSNGTPAYSYTWSTGATTPDVNNIPAGNYTLIIMDASNCVTSQTASITEPTAPLASSASNVTAVNCFGAATGSATINSTGGTPAYSYTWMPGNVTSNSINNVVAGIYTVTTMDNNGCVTTNTITILNSGSSPITVSLINSESSTCEQSNGTISVDVTGGTPNYTYQWNAGRAFRVN
jgi:hypothetical protein